MRGLAASVIAAVVTVLVFACAHAENASQPVQIGRGEDLYLQRCSDCHGTSGERRALGRSKALNRLSRSDIIDKLRRYQQARRVRGMKDKMKSGLIGEDIEALAAYIRLFERK